MQVITPGHRYELENSDGGSSQTLQFVEKAPLSAVSPTELFTVTPGTTNEEVLRVLLDRLQYLNKAVPCRENSIAYTHLETALLYLEKRTADRKARGVEGKAAA